MIIEKVTAFITRKKRDEELFLSSQVKNPILPLANEVGVLAIKRSFQILSILKYTGRNQSVQPVITIPR